MTSPPVPAELTLGFPAPGPLLAAAYRDLYLAAEGSQSQKATVGDPALLPKPWDPPTIGNPHLRAELWTWLDAVVVWINHEYTWDPDGTIPPCWPQHPHLVHEIAVLADQRRRAGLALDSSALEEWHRYTLPGFLERTRSRLKAHCDQDHQPWPGRSRHARHTNERHTQHRQHKYQSDTLLLRRPEPAPSAPPRLPMLNTDTDDIEDCHRSGKGITRPRPIGSALT